jgi:putative oxidoreductase
MKQIKLDLGKLLLRLGVGGLMLFHGIHKMINGFQGIKDLLSANNLPEILWIGVPIGEILAPLCILIGVFTRISALLVAITMFFSIYLAHAAEVFQLGQSGAPVIELNLLYLLGALALFFIGAGRYALYKREVGFLA